jgi:hypothetical protein
MANPEHLAILMEGVDIWNRWRGENLAALRIDRVDLSGAELSPTSASISLQSAALRRGACLSAFPMPISSLACHTHSRETEGGSWGLPTSSAIMAAGYSMPVTQRCST